ncbi:5-oxoprolinase subunit PxpB [Altibacter sp.]|uniref:5-oxoprolinase subunit PxpB n=1 Tax=Altibacter sp. TaxID=2024823 RepID=UPI000C922891|nr:5-oxoprolinase subunit PxpB [Altibacter sp.]MAP54931.1 allophanate hydrolase [Altibacter sp.]
MNTAPDIQRFGMHGVQISFPSEISFEVHRHVLAWQEAVIAGFSEKIVDVVPAYHSLAVFLKEHVNLGAFIDELKDLSVSETETAISSHCITVPVCYDETFGLDLKELSEAKGISIEHIIQKHTAPTYQVYFLGFLPGFPYLGGLDTQLSHPRKSTSRPKIAKGAVAIGGSQTGIYPMASPGGWNILGRTPLEMFNPQATSPTLVMPGDYIKFRRISMKEFDAIASKLAMGTYSVEKEVYHG